MIQKQLEKVIVGASLAAAASVLVPIIKEVIPPIVKGGREGLGGLVEKTKDSFSYIREELEDIVAEAQFERMQKQMEHDIASTDEC